LPEKLIQNFFSFIYSQRQAHHHLHLTSPLQQDFQAFGSAILYPVLPIIRFSVEMSYGYDQYFSPTYLVYDAIRKTPGLASPCSFRAGMPRFRKLGNSVQGIQDFRQESIPKTGKFSIVKLDCLIELNLGNFKKFYLHFLLTVFLKNFLYGNCPYFSLIVGIYSAFSFF
jgi:hypothetical protein